MTDQEIDNLVRPSRKQVRSNPILHSQRSFVAGTSRRDQERKQLYCLINLQSEGIQIFRTPEFIRVENSSLPLSEERVGVVGLVVDSTGTGYVTRLKANPSSTWDVSADLPFRAIHLQNLLLKLLGEQGIDHGLPELLSFQITDTLGERCEGDSMDIAGLLAIVDSIHGNSNKLFVAACACVSPTADIGLEPAKSIRIKLDAFKREIGCGSLLIRHTDDLDAASFDVLFENVWQVKDLTDLRSQLQQADLIDGLQNNVPLRPEQAPAITARIESLMHSESTFTQAGEFIARLRNRFTEQTPLRIRLEVMYAEEDLHRHSGRFDRAIEICHQRAILENDPSVTCYERRTQTDNRLAASLYDGHRFDEADKCLTPWIERFDADPQICLPETRAILMNTLSRCLVPRRDDRWESLLQKSFAIQQMTDPSSADRTINYLIHGYLKTNRLDEAGALLAKTHDEKKNAYLVWLNADYARRRGHTCEDVEQKIANISWESHACGLALQAFARQPGRTSESRLTILKCAKRSFLFGIKECDATNIKRLMAGICHIGICLIQEPQDIEQSIDDMSRLLSYPDLSAAKEWYEKRFQSLRDSPSWGVIDDFFERVPHF